MASGRFIKWIGIVFAFLIGSIIFAWFVVDVLKGSVITGFIFLILVILGFLYIYDFKNKKARYERELASLKEQSSFSEREIISLKERSSFLETENARLAKWAVVEDADVKAKEMIEQSQQNAVIITSEARKQAESIREEAKSTLDAAANQARTILDDANLKAEEIAGSALDAKNKAEHYEQTAKALKNIIEGYGDEYLIPAHNLLDDLAEEFGYEKAGQELKKAREKSRLISRQGTAAICSYVEASRRETAINFVIDAFNGKVDSILSRVKHDNVGKLQQEIKDAFRIVNHNGKAFRDAQITVEYMDARLEELKWAAIAQQLKIDEREEQRRIKEQIREEEKARREYERALRETAKEEELLKKAMEKAQAQIEQASAEQKAKYELQLQELSEKLKLAEEKNQRALSMAQQTKRGSVYIISNMGSFGEHVYKVGLTRRLEPLDRIRELGDSSVPFEFDVHALIYSEDAPALERQLHKHFVINQMNKVNHRKEFFKVDLRHIREEIEKLGLESTVKWTMTAKAQEYHETLAIEKAISSDPAQREAWLSRQLVLDPLENGGGEVLEMETVSAGV